MNWRLVYAPNNWIVWKNIFGGWMYHAGVFASIEQYPMMVELPLNWEPLI